MPLFMMAQTPYRISYQSIVRKADASLVVSGNVSFKFEVLQGEANGTVVYAETQTKSTNSVGFFSAQIGGGNVLSGSFSSIDWSTGVYFLRISIDVNGGSNFSFLESSELLPVPYAFHSITSDSVVNKAPANYSLLHSKPTNIDEDKSNDVTLGTAQDVAGTKTFTGEMIVSSPALDTHVVNKAYVDALSQKIAKMQNGVDSIQRILDEVVLDFDGNRYTPVRVGTQIWLEEPLITTHFSNGDPISLIATQSEFDSKVALNDTITSMYCFANFNPLQKKIGVLYNYPTILNSKKVCPMGYKVPTEQELTYLLSQFGSISINGSLTMYRDSLAIGLNFKKFNVNQYGFNVKSNVALLNGFYTSGLQPVLATQTRAISRNLFRVGGFNVASISYSSQQIKSTLAPIRCIKED